MLSSKSVGTGSNVSAIGARPDWREIGSLVRAENLTLVHGICLPASCSAHKVVEYANKILSEAELEAFDAICRTDDAVPIEALDVFAM